MSTTTYEAIVETFRAALEARTPTKRTDVPFRRYGGDHPDFTAWAQQMAEGSFRVFDIRHSFDTAFVPPHDLQAYFAQHTTVVQIAYPDVSLKYGTGVDLHGDNLIDTDLYDIDKVIGQPAARIAGHHDSLYVGQGVVRAGDVRVLSFLFQLTYNRSIPS